MAESNPEEREKSFGSELWNHIDQVDTYLATGVEYQLSLSSFIKGYAQAEFEYAAHLLRISKPFRDAIVKSKDQWQKQADPILTKQLNVKYSGTVMKAWERLLAQTEAIAQLHYEISEAMTKERKDIKLNGIRLETQTKLNFENIKISQIELSKLIESMERFQQAYEKELKTLESCGAHLKKSIKEKKEKEAEKYRLELEKQIAAVKHSLFYYKTAVDNTNAAKNNHYNIVIPNVLTEMQKEDESSRIAISKSSMTAIANYVASATLKAAQTWAEFKEIANCINENYDSQLLINSFCTHDYPPVDFSYLDPKDTFKKKQNLFPKNIYEREEKENLEATQPKPGRKKAGERIKSIEKDMADLEKKRLGLIGVISTLNDLSYTENENAITEINSSKNDLEIKLNLLTQKKQFFLEYIAELDGKPAPPLPALLSTAAPVTPKGGTSMVLLKNNLSSLPSFHSAANDSTPLKVTDELCSSSSPQIEVATPKEQNSDSLSPLTPSISELPIESSTSPGNLSTEHPNSSVKGNNSRKIDTLLQSSDRSNQKHHYVIATGTKPAAELEESTIPRKEHEKIEVLYDFEAAEGSPEMSVKAGKIVEVLEEECGDGWARCRLVDDPTIDGLMNLKEFLEQCSYFTLPQCQTSTNNTRQMEIVYVYQKKRSEFGKQALLSDRVGEVSLSILPDPAYMKNYTERNPTHTEIQATPDKSEHEVNTESYVVNSCGILHTQGGWPKDVDATDVEHTIRYRKKIEKDEEYMRVIKSLGDSMEHTIKQNNAIDIYQEYFPDSNDFIPNDAPSAKSLNVYRDPNAIKRAATYLSWYPEEGHKIAAAYSVLQFQGMPSNMSLDSYIWDLENPNAPDQTLTPTSPLVCIKYNPKDPHILVGGSYNGLLSYWDTRKGAFPVDTSPQEKSHRDPVYNVAWVQSKSGSEFFSVSTDGQALWWDIRKLSEPTETMTIDPEKNGVVVGGTVLDFEPTMPTKFMIGGENGSAFMCNKKAKSPGDKITHIYPGHYGPVYALQRNPFFVKNFLTVGDWKAQIWSEDIRSPIMSTKYSMSYLTDGCWSPTRPSVFFTAKMDGSIDIWDYLFKQVEPTYTVQVCNSPLHSIKTQEHGKLMAASARDGSVTLFELSESLSKLQNNEKRIFSEMLEREAKREKTLESAVREKRAKAAQKRPNSAISPTGAVLEELLRAADEEFFELIDDGSGRIKDDAKARVLEYDS